MPDDSQTYSYTLGDIQRSFERAERLARGLPADPEDDDDDAPADPD